MTMTSREFFATKPRVIEYMALDLYHPAFGYLRYVQNQFYEKTLGGNVYQPIAMSVTESVADDRATVSYEIQLGRVGSEVKAFVKAIDQYAFGWMIEIDATVSYYLSTDLVTPYRTPVSLSVGTLAMEAESVAITLETGNPRAQGVARRYGTDDFPGLKTLI